MHELSLLENVRDILEAEAQKQGFTKVTQVTLAIGKLSCVEPDALRFGFGVVMQGSLADGADLLIEDVEGLGRCRQCERQFAIATLYEPCVHCGCPHVDVIQGMDMKVKDLLVV